MGDIKYETWDKVSVDEMLAYMGFMVLMGLVQLPSINDYWKRDPIFHYQPIASKISRNRFFDIHRFLHFTDNSSLLTHGHPNYDRLGKVRPILNYLNNKFSSLFTPGRDQSIDEAMIPFKGHSSMKQYMPKKPIKRGFKVWMRAESKSGYVSEFDVYTGKKGDRVERGLGASVVMNLTKKIINKNHHVYFDNFFTSINLLLDLQRLGIYSNGTMRADRKGFPADLKKYIKKGLPERGQHVAVQCRNLVVTLWQDTKPFFCSSTNADPNKTSSVTRKKKDGTLISLPCPQSVLLYNEHMGGVDRNDQLRGYYHVRLKCRKYYKYIFWCLFDVAITNMYLLCRDYTNLPYNTTKEFRVDLAKDLIGNYNSRKRLGRPSTTSSVKKFCQHHFPVRGAERVHRCHYCSRYCQRRRETVWYCQDCELFLCHNGREDDCFRLYHTIYGPAADPKEISS